MNTDEVTEKIIGAAYTVGNDLGSGFLEKVCENALAYELRQMDLKAEQQRPIAVSYRGVVVGAYFADLLVADLILVEVKTVRTLDQIHLAQCLNYLKASGLKHGLILNFGTPKVQVKRVVYGY